VDVRQHLENVLGCRGDPRTPDSLKPRLRESALAEVFAIDLQGIRQTREGGGTVETWRRCDAEH